MIAVIADDLTGAAELGGIGLRKGLKTEICMEVPLHTKAGLLVIATDTRSMHRGEAVTEMEKVTEQLMSLRPEWIYKKTDSVLRGHVVGELTAQLKLLGLRRCLLVPSNPALGRTIRDGRYYIDGRPAHLSSFAADPEFPVTSSLVQDMLPDGNVQMLPPGTALPHSGIALGEAAEDDDLYHWAGRVGADTFPAGASGFFTALLRQRDTVGGPAPAWTSPVLFVSGTTFGRSRETIGMEEIVRQLREEGKAVVGTGKFSGEDPRLVKERMAKLIRQVLNETTVGELIIEGGATAHAILSEAGWRTFVPVEELAPGVVRMRAGELYITVKPGSYPWPEKNNLLPV